MLKFVTEDLFESLWMTCLNVKLKHLSFQSASALAQKRSVKDSKRWKPGE